MIGCKLQATYGRLGVMMCHMLLGPLQTNLYDYTVKEKGACFMPRLIKLMKPAYMKPNDMDVFHVMFPFQLEGESAPTDLVFAPRRCLWSATVVTSKRFARLRLG